MSRIWSGGASKDEGPDLSEIMTREDNLVDSLLIRYEIFGLIAYHLELAKSNVLKPEESREILSGLIKLSDSGLTMDSQYEDVHSLVEDSLKKITPAGNNLRVFLSRNDQSHYDIRSCYIDTLLEISSRLLEIADSLMSRFSSLEGYMPGYTHYRQAMPMSISTYFDYIASGMVEHSKEIMLLSDKLSEYCPLGYGSGYGSAVNVDFDSLAKSLGYRKFYKNPLSGASHRGMDDLEVVFYAAKTMTFISRIAQDFILFSSEESGFLILPDGYTTGSSLMPNKRNPDFLEMLQGYAADSLGVLTSSFSILMNKEIGYHREFQISKDRVINHLQLLLKILEALKGFASALKVDQRKAQDRVENQTHSTMEAYSMFRGGIPWKEAYLSVGNKLRTGERISEHVPPAIRSLEDITIRSVKREVLRRQGRRMEVWNFTMKKAEESIL